MLKELSLRFIQLYAKTGRPSVAPERLLRALLLQVLYSIRSERARERGAKRMSQGVFETEMTRLGFEVVEAWANRNKRQRWRGVWLRGPDE